MKILFLDIETSPNIAHVWGLWKQNVGLKQLMDSTQMLCYAASFYGDKKVVFKKHDDDSFLTTLWSMVDEADAIVHFNGTKFDMPHINREFLEAGFEPPSTYKQIDLLTIVKKTFRFPSNKLEYVAKRLGCGEKIFNTEGHTLWVKVMAGDTKAWSQMKTYNIQDTVLLETLYDKLKPWIKSHPNHGLYKESDRPVCTNCGKDHLVKRGYAYTNVSKFQRYRCCDCGSWMRGRENLIDRTNLTVSIA